MIALIQRVTQAKVEVEGQIVGQIGKGLLVLLGVEKEDDQAKADKLAEKVLNYRIFSDENDKMNLNVQQIGGEVLVVSQFTLAADTQKGLRPSFSKGAAPALANELYEYFSQKCAEKVTVANGQIAAGRRTDWHEASSKTIFVCASQYIFGISMFFHLNIGK